MTLSYITDIRVEVVEIERKMINETYISASLARKCIENATIKRYRASIPINFSIHRKEM